MPNYILYLAAGGARYRFLRFAVLDLIGTMLYIVPIVWLGYALGGSAVHVAGLVTRYSIIITVALVAGLIVVAWWRSRRARTASARAAGPGPARSAPPPPILPASCTPTCTRK